ncbi:unnamed protein product [Cylicocyclus nassatus]|uniref:Uncharacterized protein n=1 Tax=Cylicocyclus nassatus TaxID=53992 RepID=A0AA36H7P6_CYLNA|nr:unnamed protein product [Cylicocyclus nassatus]
MLNLLLLPLAVGAEVLNDLMKCRYSCTAECLNWEKQIKSKGMVLTWIIISHGHEVSSY